MENVKNSNACGISLNPLKKDSLSFQNIGKPQVPFVFSVLLFMFKYSKTLRVRTWIFPF